MNCVTFVTTRLPLDVSLIVLTVCEAMPPHLHEYELPIGAARCSLSILLFATL